MRWKLKIAGIFLLILTLLPQVCLAASYKARPNSSPANYSSSNPARLNADMLYATSAVAVDASSGRVLFSKEPDRKIYPASTTKVMTALLALENLDMDQEVTVTKSCMVGESSIYLEDGEILTVRELLYGLLLNRLKGSEMSVTTYVGFSVVSLMCIAWLVLPFKSPIMKWPLGNGLRTTIGLQTSYRHVLNDFLSFEIFGVTIPTGLLLFFAACCLAVWLFMRSKTGIAMSAAGANPRFAAATGINVDRMRIIGTMLSTMLAAVGIIVYGQSYGFMQLYQAPRQMGFLAASAILIGGATTSRAKISNVVIGTFLFQGVLTLGMPVANALVPQSTISETLRILISNGIILYALTKSGGANRG